MQKLYSTKYGRHIFSFTAHGQHFIIPCNHCNELR